MTSINEFLHMARTLVRAIRREKPSPEAKDSLGRRVELTAAKYGEHLALVCEGESLTWNELNRRINRTAHFLKSLGIQRGDCVALMMENRLDFLICAIGITKLGAIAGLMNTNQRHHVLVHSIKLTKAKKFIVGAECFDAVEEIRQELPLQAQDYILIADRGRQPNTTGALLFAAATSEVDDANPSETQQIQLKDTCFYILTSGTTGLPKAALFSHARFVAAMFGFGSICLDAQPQDRIYLTLPLYHATALTCGLGSAVYGGSALILRRKFSASQFFADIRTHQCTAFVYIGELCRYLTNLPTKADDRSQPAKKCIGNGLRPDIWDNFKQRYGIERISEFYGASEGNNAFINAFNKDRTLGFPVMKCALVQYDIDRDEIVRDNNGRCISVPRGQAGLLVNEISQAARYDGYTDDKASDAKLIRNVFREGDLYFNTGDLLKEVDVGFAFGRPHYQFVDRVGDTFRWKGENCSTNEVAEAINGFPGIVITNVYGVQVPGADGRAGMAAVAFQDSDIDWAAFAKYLRDSLPAYARPVFVRVKQDLATTSTFKLVKSELKSEAYHLDRVNGDNIRFLDAESGTYQELDAAVYRKICDGNQRF